MRSYPARLTKKNKQTKSLSVQLKRKFENETVSLFYYCVMELCVCVYRHASSKTMATLKMRHACSVQYTSDSLTTMTPALFNSSFWITMMRADAEIWRWCGRTSRCSSMFTVYVLFDVIPFKWQRTQHSRNFHSLKGLRTVARHWWPTGQVMCPCFPLWQKKWERDGRWPELTGFVLLIFS